MTGEKKPGVESFFLAFGVLFQALQEACRTRMI